MIQMLPDAVLELRKALREMQDYFITIGSNATQNSVTHVNVEWVSRDTNKQTWVPCTIFYLENFVKIFFFHERFVVL